MKEYIRVGAVVINLKATPYIFVGDNRDKNNKLNKQYPNAVFCSTVNPYEGGRHTEWMLLRGFTASVCAWNWLVTHIYEEKFTPRLLKKWKLS